MTSQRLIQRRVKIIATLGPSLYSKEDIKKAISSGMNVARLNFSHGKKEEHLDCIRNIRELSKELKTPVGIIQDLQGPKIRVGQFKKGFIQIEEGTSVFVFYSNSDQYKESRKNYIPTPFKDIASVCKKGTRILMDDGLIEVVVRESLKDKLKCDVIHGGILENRKGMNIPGVSLPLDSLTQKDLEDLEFGLSHSVDYIALSFVKNGSDVLKLRELINKKNKRVQIISKIEVYESIRHLKEIINLSDAVMVARGDLTIEVGQTQLPWIQKKIIKICNEMGKPVITATQMLDSMVENPRPTRAEVTDVANAVLDGSDALMLSQETAKGKRPNECIQTMNDIILAVERNEDYYYKLSLQQKFQNISGALGASAAFLALELNASAITCLTTTGKTATLISSFRPKARIIAATDRLSTLNRLSIVWGIETIFIQPYSSEEQAMNQIAEVLIKKHNFKKGDKVILTLGRPILKKEKTNSLRVYVI